MNFIISVEDLYIIAMHLVFFYPPVGVEKQIFENVAFFGIFCHTHEPPVMGGRVINFTIYIPLILTMLHDKIGTNWPCSFQEFNKVKL